MTMFTFAIEIEPATRDHRATWELSGKRFLSIEGASRAMAKFAEVAAENNSFRPLKIVKL